MRIAVLIVILVIFGGCASTGQKTADVDIPVKSQDPSPLDRWRIRQQRINEQSSTARTEVTGTVTR